jgi:hypothetical protein
LRIGIGCGKHVPLFVVHRGLLFEHGKVEFFYQSS